MTTTSHQQSLLPSTSPTKKTSSKCNSLLLFTLTLTTIISITTLLSTQFLTSSNNLCIQSPNPTSCNAIVTKALLSSPQPQTPLQILLTIFHQSLITLNSTVIVPPTVKNELPSREKQALIDCEQLLDLSYDRVLSSASAATNGAINDARTWMSSVLTNYETCLEGHAEANPATKINLDHLKNLASASLAILNSIDTEERVEVDKFPAWLSSDDLQLLGLTSASFSLLEGVQADAVVDVNGNGDYTTVQEALNAVPAKNEKRFVIYVKKGLYKETVRIEKKKTVMIVGDGADETIISGDLNNVDGTTTFNSATLAAHGDGLILQDLKIENTAGPQKHQAVALRVNADRSVINRCHLAGYQDTLYVHSNRQFYRDSTISGTIDFIFGNAAAVLQNCTIVALKPMLRQNNVVTAQSRTDPNENTAISIHNCRILPSEDLEPVVGSTRSYLGRPWKEYSRTVVMQSYIGGHIDSKGWLEWKGEFALETLFYGEFENAGPGSGTAGRVDWAGFKVISDPNVAMDFSVGRLIQGGSWLEGTSVDYVEGLCDFGEGCLGGSYVD